MDVAVPDMDSQLLEACGRQLYHSSAYLHALAEIADHPLCADFLDRYVHTREEGLRMLVFLKCFRKLSKMYTGLSGYQKLFLIYCLSNHPTLKKKLMHLNSPSTLPE